MWLPDHVIKTVEDARVTVFYLSYAACRHWAEHRERDEPLVFSGWYWARGGREAGPFKSQSAAWRDAWFSVRSVRGPSMSGLNARFESDQTRRANLAKRKRIHREARV